MMKRTLALSLAVLGSLGSVGAVSAGPTTSVMVTGSLTAGGAAGSFVTASCAPRGSILTGSGALYGVNPQNGYRYSYPFLITSSRTVAPNQLILTGNMINGPRISLTATSPSGKLTFAYLLANGTTVVSTGQGTVTVR